MNPPRAALLTLLAMAQDLRADHPSERRLADEVEFAIQRRLLDLELGASVPGQKNGDEPHTGTTADAANFWPESRS